MRHRRFCWLGLMVPLGVLLAPPFLWVLIVLVAPTNWARSHVIAKLERSSGALSSSTTSMSVWMEELS